MSKASVIDGSTRPMGPPHLHAIGCGPACGSKPCSSISSRSSTVQPSATALKEFRKRWTILSESERIQCLKGTGVQFFAMVAELVPCLACRSGAESLFLRATTTLPLLCGSLNPNSMINSSIQLNDSGAILFHTDQSFVLNPSYLQTADATLALFLSHEVQHVIQTTAGMSKHKNHQKQSTPAAHHHAHHPMMPPFPPGPHLHQLTKHNTTLKVKTTTFNYETTMKLQMHSSGTSSMLTTTTTHHGGPHPATAAAAAAAAAAGMSP
ncbi:hypothetical protein As57867_011509, partial [Aphanomyces stellatus]